MTAAREGHTATLLPNRKVLIAGGDGYSVDIGSSELYEPGSGTFTATGNMTTYRSGHTATLLPNGKVLIAGGSGDASAELYNPTAGTFAVTGKMTAARQGHTATLLSDGKVLIAGGAGVSDAGVFLLARAELYDPEVGTFTATGNMTVAR
ncbi:MAG TPA: kelch repeat-containing protein [Polyangia bacterium]|nr:kelch repeat-containing protein [Polyangia bacterium]